MNALNFWSKLRTTLWIQIWIWIWICYRVLSGAYSALTKLVLVSSQTQGLWKWLPQSQSRDPEKCGCSKILPNHDRAWTACIILGLNSIWPFCSDKFPLWAKGSIKDDYHWVIEDVHHFSLLNLSESAQWIIAYWTEYDWASSTHQVLCEMATILQIESIKTTSTGRC